MCICTALKICIIVFVHLCKMQKKNVFPFPGNVGMTFSHKILIILRVSWKREHLKYPLRHSRSSVEIIILIMRSSIYKLSETYTSVCVYPVFLPQNWLKSTSVFTFIQGIGYTCTHSKVDQWKSLTLKTVANAGLPFVYAVVPCFQE